MLAADNRSPCHCQPLFCSVVRCSESHTLVRQECERQKCERHQCEANSANANSAKGSTVRMRQECECQMCECQQCDATSVRKKCDRCANDNSAKRTLCRDTHALLYRQKPEFWDRQSHFSPPITPSLTITELKYPYPYPNPRTVKRFGMERLSYSDRLSRTCFFDDLLGSVTLPLP